MTIEVQMLARRPKGPGEYYEKGVTYPLSDDLATVFIRNGVARRTSLFTERTEIPARLQASGKRYDVEDGLVSPLAVDDLTGSVLGLQPTLRQFCRFVLPLNQSGGPSVLPTDYSPRKTQCTIGLSNGAPWANAGDLTTYAGAGDSTLIVPASAATVDLAGRALMFAATVKKAIPAGIEAIAGGSNGTLPGLLINMNTSGNVGPRLFVAAGINFTGAYGTAVVGGAAYHRLCWFWDAQTRTIEQYVDGVLDFAAVAAQPFAATEIAADTFRLGRGNSGNTAAAQFRGAIYAVFDGASAPVNRAEIAKIDALYPQGGGINAPVFL